jgi:hypothetical protein
VYDRDTIAKFEKDYNLPKSGLFDWLTRMDELMLANLKALTALTELLGGQYPGMGEITVTAGGIAIPAFGVRIDQILSGNMARSTEEIFPDHMADCRGAIRVVVVVRNEFDQNCTYSIIGNIGDSYTGAIEIASGTATAGTPTLYNLAFEEWEPWVGCTLTPGTGPSSGSADVYVIVQE